jgi:hypothetical protein
MRSKGPAEFVLLFAATAVLEGAWLTLANILLQWLMRSATVAMGILPFCLAVAAGMLLGRYLAQADQARYAIGIAVGAIAAGVIAALLSGAPTSSFGDFLGHALVDPGAWLIGIAVVRGTAQSDPGSGYESERIFGAGIPALVVFWVIATGTAMTGNADFTAAAFSASLTFVSAGLLSLGLGRLRDLNVDAVDRAARQRWVGLVIGIVMLVLFIGIPLSLVLGLPISSAFFGALGPLAPVLDVIFTLLAIPLFALISAFVDLLRPSGPIPTLTPIMPVPSGAPQPELPQPPTGAAPDLTPLLVISLIIGLLVLVRVLFLLAGRANVEELGAETLETRSSEPITLPSLRLPRLRRAPGKGRRGVPLTAAQAYVLSLEALAGGPHERLVTETPREHATRIRGASVGADIGRLATDYQLDRFAQRRLSATEIRRAIERWRRVVARVRAK